MLGSQVGIANSLLTPDFEALKQAFPCLEFNSEHTLFFCTYEDHGFLEWDIEKILLHYRQFRNSTSQVHGKMGTVSAGSSYMIRVRVSTGLAYSQHRYLTFIRLF